MRSMTGYGKGVAEKDDRKVTVEIKSVNHRFLDILLKMPKCLQFSDDAVRKAIGAVCSRGHLEVYVTYEDNTGENVVLEIDEGQALKYLGIAKRLEELGFQNNFGVENVIRMTDVVKTTVCECDEEVIKNLVVDAVNEALAALIVMRETEGGKLGEDLKLKVCELESGLNFIKERAPLVADEYSKRLEQKVREALDGGDIETDRIAAEVAIFIDRSNIDEEITRLYGHISHYREILGSVGAVGKRLDFLTQEANREVNTIGSKSNDMLITKEVLRLKNIIEMMREQVQNLE